MSLLFYKSAEGENDYNFLLLECGGFAKIEKLNQKHVCNCLHIGTYLGVLSLEHCKQKATQEGGNAFNWQYLNNDCFIKRCPDNTLSFQMFGIGGLNIHIYTNIHDNIYEC